MTPASRNLLIALLVALSCIAFSIGTANAQRNTWEPLQGGCPNGGNTASTPVSPAATASSTIPAQTAKPGTSASKPASAAPATKPQLYYYASNGFYYYYYGPLDVASNADTGTYRSFSAEPGATATYSYPSPGTYTYPYAYPSSDSTVRRSWGTRH
jgi:hypothetical protein